MLFLACKVVSRSLSILQITSSNSSFNSPGTAQIFDSLKFQIAVPQIPPKSVQIVCCVVGQGPVLRSQVLRSSGLVRLRTGPCPTSTHRTQSSFLRLCSVWGGLPPVPRWGDSPKPPSTFGRSFLPPSIVVQSQAFGLCGGASGPPRTPHVGFRQAQASSLLAICSISLLPHNIPLVPRGLLFGR